MECSVKSASLNKLDCIYLLLKKEKQHIQLLLITEMCLPCLTGFKKICKSLIYQLAPLVSKKMEHWENPVVSLLVALMDQQENETVNHCLANFYLVAQSPGY